jgi:hypothetical protein
MTRLNGPTVVIAVVLVLVALWIASNTEWGEVELPTPLRGDAATNPFYAAQKLVETLGATSERRESLGDASTDGVVVLSTWAWDIADARRGELERWVEAGGRLVVDAALITGSDAFERWSGITRAREEQDADEDLFQAREILELCRTVRETRSDNVVTDRFEVCNLDPTSWLETSRRAVWALDDEDVLVAARVAVGDGTVTVINGVPFVYRQLFEGEHGEVFAAATQLRVGDHFVFMSEEDVSSLLELVWRHGAPVVMVLLLFIALALWRGAMRFGPLVAPAERARRSLAEQILGTGRFAVRVGGGAALVAAAQRALNEAATRRIVGYERLPVAEQVAAVARLAGAEAAALAAAMEPSNGQRSPELRAKLAQLEAARRQLISGSRWSKHGKRI